MSKRIDLTKRGLYSTGMFLVTIIFFYAPLLLLTIFSFNESKTMVWKGFSLKWYETFIYSSPQLWLAFEKSLLIALSSAFVSTIIGTLGAIGLYRYSIKFKKPIELITLIPLLLPEIIMGVSLLIFFAGTGVKLGLFTIFLAHTTFCLPFVFLIMMSRLEEFDQSIIEAAYDLGAMETDVLFKIILPMSVPAIIASYLISMTLSLEDFVITFFVAGPGATTLPLYIYSMIRFGVSPVINVLSVFIIVASVLLTLLTLRFSKYLFK
ncbi:MAG: ABC transporter permease [Candidatus Margulisbacteria bacterium]|nr:ABC transporter permease [Candidatus Margulisiibacteriota bacterium]